MRRCNVPAYCLNQGVMMVLWNTKPAWFIIELGIGQVRKRNPNFQYRINVTNFFFDPAWTISLINFILTSFCILTWLSKTIFWFFSSCQCFWLCSLMLFYAESFYSVTVVFSFSFLVLFLCGREEFEGRVKDSVIYIQFAYNWGCPTPQLQHVCTLE